jgi:hypothetical protein
MITFRRSVKTHKTRPRDETGFCVVEDGGSRGRLQIQLHLRVDQSAADAEHAVAENGAAEGRIEEAAADRFELGVVEFFSVVCHKPEFGWLVWLVVGWFGGSREEPV